MEILHITDREAGGRVDKFIRKLFPTLPLSACYKLLRKKDIRVNGAKADPKYKLEEGDELHIRIPREKIIALYEERRQEHGYTPVKPTFKVLYEDRWILVVDKPDRLPCHGGSGIGNNTLINQVLTYLNYKPGDMQKPALMHRIDKDTTGIVVVAKDESTLRQLHGLMKRDALTKKYIAATEGIFEKKEGKIESYQRKTENDSGKQIVTHKDIDDSGQESRTLYKVTQEFTGKGAGQVGVKQGISLVELTLLTGRTHQLRSHMRYIGHSILGDPKYGDFEINKVLKQTTGLKRQFLHATYLSFPHPKQSKVIEIHSPLPRDLEKVLKIVSGKL